MNIDKNKAKILEIFSSIQGEGPYVGQRQIFLRFSGCNIKCSYCDVPKYMPYRELDAKSVFKRIERLNGYNNKAVSLTGGEPLLWVDFLNRILPLLRRRGFKIYLETNGILHDNLRKIIRFVDTVSMDIKLPSSSDTKAFWIEHKKFLSIASKKKVFIKAVITDNTKIGDIKKLAAVIEGINPDITLILQPVTSPKKKDRPTDKFLLGLQEYLLKRLNDVRIIPQVHKILNMR